MEAPPPAGIFKLNIDGASRGNLGSSGAGVIIRDAIYDGSNNLYTIMNGEHKYTLSSLKEKEKEVEDTSPIFCFNSKK